MGDIIIGVVGAFLGRWIFRALGSHTPFGRIAGTVVVAFVGAVLLMLMLMLRAVRRRRV